MKKPNADFIRKRKISFSDICWFLIGLQGKSLPNELLDFFEHSINIPMSSAYIQQREKMLLEAWDFLFQSFRNGCSDFYTQTFRGYRLLAVDGSDVNIARNPQDDETFIHEGERGYNALHMNALYDILNHVYVDAVFQGKKKLHERLSFNRMVDRYRDRASIFIADRGYESFNTFAHIIQSGQYFLIRMKDIDSNGILGAYDLPNGEFDERIESIPSTSDQRETGISCTG